MTDKENKIKTVTNVEGKDFRTARKELANAFKIAIGHRSVAQFARECGMVDVSLITNTLNEKINVLPDRRLFRDIEKASERRVTYSYLCQICGYPEYDVDESWAKFNPERGSVYMVDLGFSNLDCEQNGIRPALIISNNTGNEKSSILTVAVITSKVKRNLPCHVNLSINDGMRHNSTICLEQMRTITKRRLFYNKIPIKLLDLSEEKIFEVNTSIEKQLGLINCMYNDDVAFELIEKIKTIEQNIKVKQSRDLFGILDDTYDKLKNYCKKHSRSHELVIRQYEKSEKCACAI